MNRLAPHALAALQQKYRALIALRREKDAHPEAPTDAARKARLRDLAQAFPGCLRELDRLGHEGLLARAHAITRALADPQSFEPWMRWIWRYHQLLKLALAHKSGSMTAPPSSEEASAEDTAAFLAATHAPAGGKLSAVVLGEVARLEGLPPRTIARALFPPRRPFTSA